MRAESSFLRDRLSRRVSPRRFVSSLTGTLESRGAKRKRRRDKFAGALLRTKNGKILKGSPLIYRVID
jgi:hypothetical protein